MTLDRDKKKIKHKGIFYPLTRNNYDAWRSYNLAGSTKNKKKAEKRLSLITLDI